MDSGIGGEEFRGLIVDICTPDPKRPPAKKKRHQGRGVNLKHEPSLDEFYRIAHPTVDDLVNGEGPSAIIGKDLPIREGYKHYRWIHIPMNNVN